MEWNHIYALLGFLISSYAVMGNDSVQTLGTFIASNRRIFPWYVLWLAAGLILTATITYSWVFNNGDISYGRLDTIPELSVQWYHATAPLVLVLLTRFGIPVSTTFLVLSTFASTVVMEKMLIKSVIGYGLAAMVSYLFWLVLARFLNEKVNKVKKEHRKYWRTFQWLSTGFLWFSWLAHDMANIAVFLPRKLPLSLLICSLIILLFWLGVIFKQGGGKIQTIVLEKTGARFMRSATIIDLIYAFLLIYFKQINSIPMSTTWVFVGLLTGRELAIATAHRNTYHFGYVFPLVGKDFLKMMIGLAASVSVVLLIHYGLK